MTGVLRCSKGFNSDFKAKVNLLAQLTTVISSVFTHFVSSLVRCLALCRGVFGLHLVVVELCLCLGLVWYSVV